VKPGLEPTEDVSVNANHTGIGRLVEKACFGKAGEERKVKARGRLTIR
jgi:hypothetical protein